MAIVRRCCCGLY